MSTPYTDAVVLHYNPDLMKLTANLFTKYLMWSKALTSMKQYWFYILTSMAPIRLVMLNLAPLSQTKTIWVMGVFRGFMIVTHRKYTVAVALRECC